MNDQDGGRGHGHTSRQYFCQLREVGSSRALSPFKHKCQVRPQVKMSVPALWRPAASTDATGSLAKPIDFPETNYPGVRDLTHKFRTAGGFSDFNHTSMLGPQSNLHCLSRAPALCQLCIDHYQALTLCCHSSLSAPSRPSRSLSSWRRENSRRGLRQRRTERVMISSWNCHWFCDTLMPSLSPSGETVGELSGLYRDALVLM